MIKTTVVVIGIIFILIAGMFLGFIPGFATVDTSTVNREHGGIHGSGELIGPNARKGFITSHINDGFSQTLVIQGRACADTWASGALTKYRYMVYGRPLAGDWEILSKPGETSKYISNPNPGERGVSGFQIGGCKNFNSYSFEFVGNTYKAVRVILEGWIDPNLLNPFDGYEWRELQIDEANLFEGWGSLSYPTRDGIPISTFEIGETAKIRVRTHYGGDVGENGKPWKVIMREPKDRGGNVFKEESYKDNVDTYFSFTVTDDMFDMGSDNTYEIEIYNTLVPKGELLVKTIDIAAKSPSNVHLEGAIQAKNGETIHVELTADVNSDTQLPIQSFQVSVVYGAMDTLLPNDPFSDRWILQTTHVTPSKRGSEYYYDLSFSADKPGYTGYVHVSAWAYDTEGRSSLSEKKFGVYIYTDSEVPEETIEDETGEDYGYGGHTEGWTPWDPSGGNWETPGLVVDWVGVFIAVLITLGMTVIGFLFFKTPRMIMLFFVVGLSFALIVYAVFYAGFI